jgi:hypothetical protein
MICCKASFEITNQCFGIILFQVARFENVFYIRTFPWKTTAFIDLLITFKHLVIDVSTMAERLVDRLFLCIVRINTHLPGMNDLHKNTSFQPLIEET